MGSKSTVELIRREAIIVIIQAADKTPYDEMTNEQLEERMYGLNIGDDTELPYYGCNFSVVDKEEDKVINK